MSTIVDKFYSKYEKLGFRKHKVSDAEISFLNTLNKSQQCDAFNEEYDYIIGRLNLKIKISFIFIFIFSLLSLHFLFSQVILMFAISLLCTFSILIIFKRLKNKLEIKNLSKIIFSDIKEKDIKNKFK